MDSSKETQIPEFKTAPKKDIENSVWSRMLGTSTSIAAVLSAIIALAAIYIQHKTFTENLAYTSQGHNLALLNNVHQQLVEHPDLWQFHGVDLQELKGLGLEPHELTYALTSIVAALSYENYHTADSSLTPYRREFLKTAKAQIAWQHAIRKLIDPRHIQFRDKVDKFIDQNPAVEMFSQRLSESKKG